MTAHKEPFGQLILSHMFLNPKMPDIFSHVSHDTPPLTSNFLMTKFFLLTVYIRKRGKSRKDPLRDRFRPLKMIQFHIPVIQMAEVAAGALRDEKFSGAEIFRFRGGVKNVLHICPFGVIISLEIEYG